MKAAVAITVIIMLSMIPKSGAEVMFQHPDNAFNQKIIDNPAISDISDEVVNFLATNQAGESGFVIGVAGWTYPIYYADDSTPVYDVSFTEDYSETITGMTMPIPDGAVPDPQDDGHLVVIDSTYEYDLWQAKKVGDAWQASWGNKIRLDSNGIFPNGLSARGSGFAATQGLVWPDEITAGKIEHALYFSIDDKFVKGGGPIAPATESDGESNEPLALPEGARLQLDPTIDLSALDLLPHEVTIARAMQEYGIILGDRGGGIQFSAARPNNYDWSAVFNEIDPNDGFAELFGGEISIKSFRLLEMGCQYQTPEVGQSPPAYKMYTQGEKGCGDPMGNDQTQDDQTYDEETPLVLSPFALIAAVVLRSRKRETR